MGIQINNVQSEMFESNVFDVESFLDNDGSRFKVPVPDKPIVDVIKKCPECNSNNIFHDTAETICRDCGIVIEDGLPENKPGYRVFGDPTKDLKRIQSEKNKIGRSMTTQIGYASYTSGNFSPEMAAKMSHLKKWDSRLKTTKPERQVNTAMDPIRAACSKLQLPDGIKEACILSFQKYIKEELNNDLRSNGKCIEDLACAFIFKTCKDRGSPYTINEIAAILKVDASKIRSNYMDILASLDKGKRRIQTPVDYIPRITTDIKVGDMIMVKSIKIVNDAMDHPRFKSISMGKNAIGYATAAVYLACLIDGIMPQRTREIISSYTDVADTTIKKRAEEIIVLLGLTDVVRESYNIYYKDKEKDVVSQLKNY